MQEDTTQDQGTEPVKEKTSAKTWLKRLGFAGFMFFLIKGLVWLGIFAGAYYYATTE